MDIPTYQKLQRKASPPDSYGVIALRVTKETHAKFMRDFETIRELVKHLSNQQISSNKRTVMFGISVAAQKIKEDYSMHKPIYNDYQDILDEV